MHVTEARSVFNAIALLAATYIQAKNDDDAPPPQIHDLVKRAVVSPKEWLHAMCTQQVDRSSVVKYNHDGDVFVPTVEQLCNIPRMFDTVALLNSQLAIVASLVHAPTRIASVSGTHGTSHNKCSIPVGVRPVIRLNFSPAGTGKTLMSMVSAIMFIKEHYATYSLGDVWRADLFGCICDAKPIAPLVLCIVSNAVHTQWKETAHACARAFVADGYEVIAFPKPGASTVKTATVVDAVNAIDCTVGGAVIYVVSSAYAQQAMENLPFLPTSFVMDEISHDACGVKYVPLPLTLLITASPKSVATALIGKRRGSILRTIFPDETTRTASRIAACNTAEPYYSALATEAAMLMPSTIKFCELSVKFNRRSNLMLGTTMDPCQFVTRDELCRLMDIDPLNKVTLSDILKAPGRDPKNRMGKFNMALFKGRFTETGQNECICCRLEVHLGQGEEAESIGGVDDYVLRAGNVIVTPCCSTMVCESCMKRLPMPQKCPQCSKRLADLGLPLIFSVSRDVGVPLATPVAPDPRNTAELIELVTKMPVQDGPCVQVIDDLLGYATSAGIKRAFVSWSSTDKMVACELERPSREVHMLLGYYSMEKPLKRRKINDEWIARYKTAPVDDTMMALIANSRDMGSDQQIAGLNLVGTELVIAAGVYDRAQIISRAMRMSVSNQGSVVVININRAA